MDESISTFCKTLGSFCNHLQSSCDALKQSVERRPIPLDSASSTFIQSLNRRVSTASNDLNLLESMSFGTVSFEELLGHCNEVLKKNQSDLAEVEDQLKKYGYLPELEIDEEIEGCELSTPLGLESKLVDAEDGFYPTSSCRGGISAACSVMNNIEDDPLFEDSLSLKNFGLSDVCLATLASEANNKAVDLDVPWKEPKENSRDGWCERSTHFTRTSMDDVEDRNIVGNVKYELKSVDVPKPAIKVTEDDYESLPSSLKCLASWVDLLAAVQKINSSLSAKEDTEVNYFFYDEIALLGLGPKARCYLLMLVRLKRLVVETINGSISYRLL